MVVLSVDRSLEARAERSRGNIGASSASGEAGVASHDQPSARAADHTTKTNVSMLHYHAIRRQRHRPELPERTAIKHIGTTLHCHHYPTSQSTVLVHRPALRSACERCTFGPRFNRYRDRRYTELADAGPPRRRRPPPRALDDALILSSLLIVIHRETPLQIAIIDSIRRKSIKHCCRTEIDELLLCTLSSLRRSSCDERLSCVLHAEYLIPK